MSDAFNDAVAFLLKREIRRLKRESAAALAWEFDHDLSGAGLARKIDEEIEQAQELAHELNWGATE